ncbi:MAG: recombinase family protein [Chloroflexota bacterium]|nr:recombinase family protein [Chloroflexota bacterium]
MKHKLNEDSAPRAAIYKRVSSEMQLQGYSLADQEHKSREYAARQGLKVVALYADEAKSATTADRPQFQQMIQDAEQGKFDVVILIDFSRFARNRRVMENFLYRLDQAGVEILSVTESIDRSEASGRAHLGMISVFNQFYTDQLAEKVTISKEARVKQRQLWNGAVPFGYAVHYKKDGGNGVPYPDPAAVDGVQLAFETYASGTHSFRDVAAELNQAGYQPRGRGKRALAHFSKDTVDDMLKNRFYLGKVSYHGEWYPGKHPAIITPELFARCQQARERRRSRHGTTARRGSRVYPLAGLARCARCGERMRGSGSSGRRYYRDPARDKGIDCDQLMVRALDAELALGEFLDQVVLPEDWQAQVITRIEADFGRPQDIQREKQRLKRAADKLTTIFQVTEMSKREFERQYRALQLQLQALKPPELPDMEQAAELLQDFGTLWATATREEQRELAHTLLTSVYLDVDDGPVVAVEPRPEFEGLFALLREAETLPKGIQLLAAGEALDEFQT